MTALRVAQAIAALETDTTLTLANQSEAEAGTENTKAMTALRVSQAIAALESYQATASQAEAEAGTENTKVMTALRVAQAIAALETDTQLSLANQSEAEAGVENTKAMTALRVAQAIAALESYQSTASQAEAEAGTENTKVMTALRVAQAIAALETDTQLSLANQSEAEAGTENTKAMTALRTKQGIKAHLNTNHRLTGNTTLDDTYLNVFVDTDGGAVQIDFPASPTDGQLYRIINCGSSGNDVTLDGNGNSINAASTQLITDGGGKTAIYDSTEEWRTF
jgi:hypothetical protein